MFDRILTFFAAEPQRKARAPLRTLRVGTKVILRTPDLNDGREWTHLRSLSAHYLQPWEPAWPKDSMTLTFFTKHWQRLMRRWVQDREYCFFIFDYHNGALVGGVSLNNIERGARQNATLGYWIGLPHTGQGFATEAAKLIIDFGFTELGLMRIEASCMPENEASQAVLRHAGMQAIGLAKNYMEINAARRDHYLFEIIKP